MKRGEVWLIALDPTVGTEIRKTRPCVIVSADDLNRVLRRIIVAPLTSGSHPAPFRVPTNFRNRPGLILLDQIRTVDKLRCGSRVGTIDQIELERSLEALTCMFAV